MTLLDKIIDDAQQGDVSTLLRRLLVLTHRLNASDLQEWVLSELNGYGKEQTLPEYRGPYGVPVRGTYSGPGGSSATNTLSSLGVPEGYGGLFEVSFSEPVAAIESMVESGNDLSESWDPAVLGLYNRWAEEGKVPYISGMAVFFAQKLVPQGLVRGILDQVRTKALQLALDIQTNFPNAGETGGPTVADPKVGQTVTQITNYIYGSVGNLAQGPRSQQTAVVGNISVVLNASRELLDQSGVKAFEELLIADEPASVKRSKLDGFVESIRKGSVSILAGVSSSVAADRILELAKTYLGW